MDGLMQKLDAMYRCGKTAQRLKRKAGIENAQNQTDRSL